MRILARVSSRTSFELPTSSGYMDPYIAASEQFL